MIRKTSIITRIAVLSVALLSLVSCSHSNPNVIARYEKGVLYEDQGLKIFSLYGTWEEMGRQWGALGLESMKNVKAFVDGMLDSDEKRSGYMSIADSVYLYYPDNLKAFFEAAAVSSGLDVDELKYLNAVEWGDASFQCSALACWDNYTAGDLVYGRNYDAFSYRPLCDEVVMMVYHPDGGQSFATVGYASEIYCVNGFNQSGLFIELNNGTPSTGAHLDFSFSICTTELFRLIAEARSFEDVDAFFETTPSTSGFLIGVADARSARSYEWYSDEYYRTDGQTPDGLMYITNHFVDPDWDFESPTDESSWMSLTRRNNIEQFTAAHQDGISVEEMKEFLRKPIAEGGVKYPEADMYQIVALPGRQKFYLNVPESEVNWAEINLERYF